MKRESSSGQLQHCQNQEPKLVMTPIEDCFDFVVLLF
jgi:hypothetical protein